MYNLKFASTYDFSVMRENNIKAVTEDYYATTRNLFCVADGVTRDLIDGTSLKYPSTKEEAQAVIEKYPNPSGATLASTICATSFIKYASSIAKVSEDSVLEVLKKINSDIGEINKSRTNIDYVKEDLYGCVAVGGIITDDYLYCFSIGDCRIKLLDDNFNTTFDTENLNHNLLPYEEPKEFIDLYKDEWKWENPKYREYYRKNIRNNVQRFENGEYSFGVLTGEETALPFVKISKVPLTNVKYILAYSDGCEECLDSKEKIISIIANPEQIKNEAHEKTLLIFEKD